MFIEEILLYLAESAWTLVLHLSAKSSFPAPLSAEEEAQLVQAMITGDGAARDKLIEHNLRLVAHIAKKYRASGCDPDDLVSIGSIGLIKAVHTFRPEAGRLTTYASRCIENEILMHLRANRKLRNTVTMSDSATFDKEGNEVQLTDLMGTDRDVVSDEVEKRITGRRVLELIDQVLDPRQAQVIRLRYGLDNQTPLRQREVADRTGISRSYVSRIEKRALKKLKAALE